MLGARPHGDAVAVHAGDGAVGLEGVMRQRGIVIRALDDEVGLGERAREIAALELVVLADVGSRNGAEPAEIAEVTGALDLRMEQRSRGSKRLLGVRRRRQLFVAHVNEPQRCGRLGFGLGDHRDHGLARVADHLVGEDRLVAVGGTEVEALDRKIGGRAHGQDSGCRGRALRMRAKDARVRHRAAPDLRVSHPGKHEVGDVTRRSRHLVARVEARDRAPDDRQSIS